MKLFVVGAGILVLISRLSATTEEIVVGKTDGTFHKIGTYYNLTVGGVQLNLTQFKITIFKLSLGNSWVKIE